MDKIEIARILEDIAAMLELKAENPFKIRAYQNGARALLLMQEDLETLVRENRLTSIAGIGKGLSENIVELVKTGKTAIHEDLKKSLHPGLLELTRIQGVGPKKAIVLHEKLGITDLPSLEKAAKEGKIAKLKGFGEATQTNILKGISFAAEHASEHLLDDAQETAGAILDLLRTRPEIKQMSVCGSLRRHKEIVRDIDILVTSAKAGPLMEFFTTLPGVTRVLGKGETKSSILYHNGIQVDLRVVKDAEFPFALHYFTGSKEHNILMRQRAIKKKWKLNEYGLFDAKEKPMLCKDEAALFAKLGLAFIPPELREGGEEITAGEQNKIPTLVEPSDIKGVFHVHSTWSDGKVELEDMIAEAEKMGFEYVGISDHSQLATYAGGLTPERVKEQGQVIEKLRKKFKIRIFWGTECDVLKDGSLDYPDSILKNYDFVIASVHSHFKLPEAEMTARVIKALRNPYTTILGHITGRLLLRRPSYAINIPEVLKVAADQGVAVEINGLADRLELDWRMIPRAKEMGCQFSCNPDAHSKGDLHGFTRAVGIARKGWLTPGDVVNTMPRKKMEAWLS